MIKNIVFDMGGVLIDYNPQRVLDKYFPPEYHSILKKEVFENPLWSQLDGGVTRSADVIPQILPNIPEQTKPLIKDMLNDFYPYMPPFENMFEFVTRIKKAGYKIYLLSNATPRFFDRYMSIPALTLMDGFFISALHKLLKPQQEIYEEFCKKFSLEPSECFFIDDMPRNIQGAKDYGMKGFVFKAPDTTDLENALNNEGVYF